MIWFDAVLEGPIEDETLQRGMAAMLAISCESVAIVHTIKQGTLIDAVFEFVKMNA